MKVIDAQVHVWGADTPARPWPGGGNPKPHRAEPWTAAELVAAMDAAGVDAAVIVPPTAQNQGAIEDDLTRVVVADDGHDDAALTTMCERAIRNYDPCISCATHFLTLRVDRR